MFSTSDSSSGLGFMECKDEVRSRSFVRTQWRHGENMTHSARVTFDPQHTVEREREGGGREGGGAVRR